MCPSFWCVLSQTTTLEWTGGRESIVVVAILCWRPALSRVAPCVMMNALLPLTWPGPCDVVGHGTGVHHCSVRRAQGPVDLHAQGADPCVHIQVVLDRLGASARHEVAFCLPMGSCPPVTPCRGKHMSRRCLCLVSRYYCTHLTSLLSLSLDSGHQLA